jgi:hypothetical protein
MRPASSLVVMFVLFGAWACDKPAPHRELTTIGIFEIDGKAPFQETGFDLMPGNYYLFKHVGGKLCVQGQRRCAPPRGSDVPGEEAWGLKVPVGADYVQVRDGLVLTVEERTPLVFYVAEGEDLEHSDGKLPLYEDNTGKWELEVLSFNQAPELDWTQGVNITSYSALGYCSQEVEPLLRRLLTLGANTVQFVVVYETDSETVHPASFSPRAFCIVRATQAAHRLGLRVGWNLHVDPPDDKWRGALKPKDRKAFFESYRQFALFWAAMAQDNGVETLIPATEMVSLMEGEEDRNRWLSIFVDLHSVFFGTIYYAADRIEFAQLPGDFWRSCCDAIGITPWYTLSSKASPTSTELFESWKEIVSNMEKFADATKLRIYLVEGPGYRALESCATDPAEYLSKDRKLSALCQAEGYKAFVKTFTSKRRQLIAGYYAWEVSIPGEEKSDYCPLGSMAESELKQAWKGQRP